MVRGVGAVAQQKQRIGADREVLGQVKGECTARGSLGQACDQRALLRRELRPPLGKEKVDLLSGDRAKTNQRAAAADRRQQLTRIFGEEKDVD